MARTTFDPGLFLSVITLLFMTVVPSRARITCKYVHKTLGVQLTKQCYYGCCGDDPMDQECCDPPEDDEDNRLWLIVGCSVGGGFVLLAIIITIVFACCVKKHNNRVKDHSNSAGIAMTNVHHVRVATPPPAYSYNAQPSGAQGNQQAGTSNDNSRDSAVFHPPPRYSSLEKKPM